MTAMTSDPDEALEDEETIPSLPPLEGTAEREELTARCAAAGLQLREQNIPGEPPWLTVGMKCGREERRIYVGSEDRVKNFLSINFEQYVFLSGFEAICSYSEDRIEAAVRRIGLFRNIDSLNFILDPPQSGFPKIELGLASDDFTKLVRYFGRSPLTLKISGAGVTSHDQALTQLKKTADATFFQIDLLSDVTLVH
jgi:hypothetical protein